MSNHAINWAWEVPVARSADRLLLVCLANHTGADNIAWPCQASLVRKTKLDPKTVWVGLARLQKGGFIVDTGERKGVTKQIIVWRLSISEETPKKEVSQAMQPTQKTDNTEIGSTAFLPSEPTIFPIESIQNSVEAPPKAEYGTLNESRKEPTKNPKESRSAHTRARPEPMLELMSTPDLIDEAVQTWNVVCGGVGNSVVSKITDSRRATLRTRLREDFGNDLAQWRRYCQEISETDFLTGGGERGWRADFDWAVKPANLVKVREGKFAARPPRPLPATYDPMALVRAMMNGHTTDAPAMSIDLARGDYVEVKN